MEVLEAGLEAGLADFARAGDWVPPSRVARTEVFIIIMAVVSESCGVERLMVSPNIQYIGVAESGATMSGGTGRRQEFSKKVAQNGKSLDNPC